MEGKQDVVWAKCGELYFAKSDEQVTEYLASNIMIIKLVPRVPLHNNLFCPKFKKVLGLILRSKLIHAIKQYKFMNWVSVITYSVATALLNWRNILELRLQTTNKGDVTLRILGSLFKAFNTVRSRILITKFFSVCVFFLRALLLAYQLPKQVFPLCSNVMTRHHTNYAGNLHFVPNGWTNAF